MERVVLLVLCLLCYQTHGLHLRGDPVLSPNSSHLLDADVDLYAPVRRVDPRFLSVTVDASLASEERFMYLLGSFLMATTEMESGSSESRSEQGTADPDSKYPLKVLYCGVCSLPTEYCEYMPEPAKCRQWLEKNFPDVFARMTVGPAANAPKQEPGTGDAPPAGEEEEKKKQKRGGRGQIKQKKKTVPQKVTIAKIPRAKKKYVTRVCGLATFDIDLKEAQRFFAQKFSCGASVTADDEIIIQGDFTDDIIDVIQEKWPEVDDDSIDDLGEVKK